MVLYPGQPRLSWYQKVGDMNMPQLPQSLHCWWDLGEDQWHIGHRESQAAHTKCRALAVIGIQLYFWFCLEQVRLIKAQHWWSNWMLTHWVVRASTFIIPIIFMPATTLPIYPGLAWALDYAGLHTMWLGFCLILSYKNSVLAFCG